MTAAAAGSSTGRTEGELTPTMEVKRATVHERYHAVFEALYA